MKPAIEFWFDFGSNYSYLAAMRIESLAGRAGVDVHWRPFMLAPIFNSLGWTTSPFVLQKDKGDYVWRDMERLARKYRIAWRRPTVFPQPAVYPMRVAVAHQDAAWVPDFCKSIFSLNFAQDRAINDNAICAQVLSGMGLDGPGLVAQAQADDKKAALRAQSEEAQKRKVFGAPTFFVGPEMFWGNDRLEDALEAAGLR